MPIWIHTLNYMAIYVEIHTHTLPPRHFLGPVVLAVYGKWIPFSIFEQTAISLLSQWRIEWERIVWNTPNTNRLQLIWAHELHSFACSLHRRLIYIFTMIIIIISTHMYTTRCTANILGSDIRIRAKVLVCMRGPYKGCYDMAHGVVVGFWYCCPLPYKMENHFQYS